MELRPGNRLEMSSHFMPEPRSWTINTSSCGLHLDCFLAGDASGCGVAGEPRLLEAAAAEDASGAKVVSGPWARRSCSL